jgi:hypothetical protein
VPPLTFFFDRCFGQKLPKLISGASPPFGVEWHDKQGSSFPQDATDDEWLSVVGAKGWIVLTHDKKFHVDSVALQAVRQHKVACFYIGGGAYPVWNKFVLFARAYRVMMNRIENQPAPYIFRVSDNGHVAPVKGVSNG